MLTDELSAESRAGAQRIQREQSVALSCSSCDRRPHELIAEHSAFNRLTCNSTSGRRRDKARGAADSGGVAEPGAAEDAIAVAAASADCMMEELS